jgi:type VI secretion system protein ImpA
MNIDDFLAPVSESQPCGENLEYDADFMAMEQAGKGKAEQQFGDTIIPAEPADWSRVEKLATSLLARTKDLRVMLALTHAWTRRRGLEGYADGLLLIERSITLWWRELYPLMIDDGEEDPFYRISALASLGDRSALSAALRQSVLLSAGSDVLTLRDALALLDGSRTECPEYPGGRPRLEEELARGGQPGVEALQLIHQRLETLRQYLVEQLGQGGVPEMEEQQKIIGTVIALCQGNHSTAPSPEQTASQQVSEPTAAPVAPAPVADWRSVSLATRDDAQLMLEKVKQYFARHEPSHPAPLMIERVQRLIEKDFMDIIRDLAPDGVNQLENIFGRRD